MRHVDEYNIDLLVQLKFLLALEVHGKQLSLGQLRLPQGLLLTSCDFRVTPTFSITLTFVVHIALNFDSTPLIFANKKTKISDKSEAPKRQTGGKCFKHSQSKKLHKKGEKTKLGKKFGTSRNIFDSNVEEERRFQS